MNDKVRRVDLKCVHYIMSGNVTVVDKRNTRSENMCPIPGNWNIWFGGPKDIVQTVNWNVCFL